MFSLSWFTTIPGILITVGVLLLIVALVIFIVTSRKSKKEKGEGVQPNVNVNVVPAPAPSIVTTNQPPVDLAMNTYGQANTNPVDVSTGNTIIMPTSVDVPTSSPYVNTVPNSASSMQPQTGQSMVMSTPNSDMNNTSVYSSVPVSAVNSNLNMGVDASPTITTLESTNTIPVIDNSNLSSYTATTMPVEPTVIQPDSFTTINNMSTVPTDGNNGGDIHNTAVSMQSPVQNEALNIQPESTMVSTIPSLDMSQSVVPVSAPTIEQVLPEMQSSQTAIINNSATSSGLSIPSALPDLQQSEVVSTSVVDAPIYGGVSTIIPERQPEIPHQIYGGANPLESTQQVPISQITSDLNNNGASVVDPIPTVATPDVSSASTVSLQQMPSPLNLNTSSTVNTSLGSAVPESSMLQSTMPQGAAMNTAPVYQGTTSSPQLGSINQNMQ